MRIRANNPVQGAALAGLGMVPVQMPINQAASAISGGKLDGSMVGPAPLMEFGISRVAPNHYLLGVSSAPLMVAMNRKKFESLPEPARQIIRNFSGRWAAEHYIAVYRAENDRAVDSLKGDPNRKVVVPSPSDLERARAVFRSERRSLVGGRPAPSPAAGEGGGGARRASRGIRRPAMKLLANLSSAARRSRCWRSRSLFLVGGIWAGIKFTTDYLLYQDATSTARNWARHLRKVSTDLEQIAAGEQPSSPAWHSSNGARKAGQVFRCEIFNHEGYSQLVADRDTVALVNLSEFCAEAARSAATNAPIVDVREGTLGRPAVVLCAGLCSRDRRWAAIAVVAAYVDQTEARDVFSARS